MSHFLDTNVCIYLLKGTYPLLKERILARRPSSIKIPAMVQAELYAGANESMEPACLKAAIDSFVSAFQIVGFDSRAALAFGEIRSNLSRASMKVGPYDLVIAATVMSRNGFLVTNNIKEFSRIDGLKIENWLE